MKDVTLALIVYDEVAYARSFISDAEKHLGHAICEILIVTSGATARDAFAGYKTSLVRTIDIAPAYPGGARNAAIGGATGHHICLCDSEIDIDWKRLLTWIQHLAQWDAIGGGLTVHGKPSGGYIPWVCFLWERWRSRKEIRDGYIRVMVVTKDAHARIGAFDHKRRAGEDFEYCRRAYAYGWTYSVSVVGRYRNYPRSLRQVYEKKLTYSSFRAPTLTRFLAHALLVIFPVLLCVSVLQIGIHALIGGLLVWILLSPIYAIILGNWVGMIRRLMASASPRR